MASRSARRPASRPPAPIRSLRELLDEPAPAPPSPGSLDPTLAQILTYLVNLELEVQRLRAEVRG